MTDRRHASGRAAEQHARSHLEQHGLRLLFVEGGGVTVSRFFGARALDRLHLVVALPLAADVATSVGEIEPLSEIDG